MRLKDIQNRIAASEKEKQDEYDKHRADECALLPVVKTMFIEWTGFTEADGWCYRIDEHAAEVVVTTPESEQHCLVCGSFHSDGSVYALTVGTAHWDESWRLSRPISETDSFYDEFLDMMMREPFEPQIDPPVDTEELVRAHEAAKVKVRRDRAEKFATFRWGAGEHEVAIAFALTRIANHFDENA